MKQHLFCKFIGSVSDGLAWEGEVLHSGFPIVAEFYEHGGDESQQGSFVGEQGRDASASFKFSVLSFEQVGRSRLQDSWR